MFVLFCFVSVCTIYINESVHVNIIFGFIFESDSMYN